MKRILNNCSPVNSPSESEVLRAPERKSFGREFICQVLWKMLLFSEVKPG